MRERCAVEWCDAEGKPHPCPHDGGYHYHGRIHYSQEQSSLPFRSLETGWFLMCDEHYAHVCREITQLDRDRRWLDRQEKAMS